MLGIILHTIIVLLIGVVFVDQLYRNKIDQLKNKIYKYERMLYLQVSDSKSTNCKCKKRNFA